MGQRIIQLCPASTEARIGWYNKGVLDLYPPTCLALVEKGTSREILYMETVDNEVKEVDNSNPEFVGFVYINDLDRIKELRAIVESRYEKERLVKSK